MNNKDIANEWFAYGKNDLNSAEFLLNMKPCPLEIICYHCQQSAEKYLKGYIALNGGEIIRTHDLTILNKICCKYESKFKTLEDDCIELVDYGVHVRYPFHIDLEEYDMRKAIESATNIKNFIESLISVK